MANMERLGFSGKYSFKNIPTPGKLEYMKHLVYSIEKLLRRMRWRAFYYLQIGESTDDEDESRGEHYENGRFSSLFKSVAKPPPIEQMEQFEKDLLNLPKNLEFRNYTNEFQREMKENLNKMSTDNFNKIIVPVDKSRNYYVCPLQEYKKLVTENISKEYRLANDTELNEVNHKAAQIARKENLERKMEIFTPGEAYVTVKDTKTGFPGTCSCRLINPAKTDIGKLSQKILKEKVTELRDKLQINHWKSTHEVLEWFITLKQRKQVTKNQPIKFIKFDIEQYYPSITKELLDKSISFAKKNGVFICKTDMEIVLTARESFLFRNGIPYVKKNRNDRFDVPMGSWDGAEVAELCGI